MSLSEGGCLWAVSHTMRHRMNSVQKTKELGAWQTTPQCGDKETYRARNCTLVSFPWLIRLSCRALPALPCGWPVGPSCQIMKYVRHLKTLPGYDANTTHVVYGQVSERRLHMHAAREDMHMHAPIWSMPANI